MQKGLREFWRHLGRLDKAFLALLIAYLVLRVSRVSTGWQFILAISTILVGFVVAIRHIRRAVRKAIWRLRNRLIAAYVFIAVVPVVLIALLAGLAGYGLIGTVAAYFVRTELANREMALMMQADSLAGRRQPGGRGGSGLFSGRGNGPDSAATQSGRGAEPGRSGPTAPNGAANTPTSSAMSAASGIAGRGPFPTRNPAGGREGGASVRPSRGATTGRNGGFNFPFPIPRDGRGFAMPPGFTMPAPNDPTAESRVGARFFLRRYPEAEVLISGTTEVRLPEDSTLKPPPPEWGRTSGLILKQSDDGKSKKLYLWAHSRSDQGEVREVTIVEPVTKERFSGIASRLGDVILANNQTTFLPPQPSRIPKKANAFDLGVRGLYFLNIDQWESPRDPQIETFLIVDSRVSAVLGVLLEQRGAQSREFESTLIIAFFVIAGMFLLVELFSLRAGVKLSQSITGAVHELYEGTQRVKSGDFTYRIPVDGDDQLADLSMSFNTMTQNLGQLIVVAKEKERLQSELEIAREVQNQLFPRDIPSSKHLELKGICKPARVVSGDYYDFMTLAGSELAFAIGDVAGKGISAALLMATIQSTMRTQLSGSNGASGQPRYSAAKLLAQLNRQLYANTTPEKYATFYFALYDETQHALTYTNAGHLPPILIHRGEITELNPTGTVVGAFPFAKYEERTVTLETGDILVAYTDGIVEPENPYGEMFGDNRLKDLVMRYAFADSSEIISRTMEAVTQWTGSSELQDDMTMVVARRLS
jgi:sigma-B regulation protein RsbU (phosphoserine phosphatase)